MGRARKCRKKNVKSEELDLVIREMNIQLISRNSKTHTHTHLMLIHKLNYIFKQFRRLQQPLHPPYLKTLQTAS